jgi:hypothetical protein
VHALHQRVVDMTAVAHAGLVGREHDRRQCLRPHRERKHLVTEDAALDQSAHGLDLAVIRGLAVVLHHPRREARGLAPILESRSRQRLAHQRDLVRRQHIADHDLHAVLGVLSNALE